jgi:glycosyltransferase involved in cell wall biosynthesis
MTGIPTISALIPALNEADRIQSTICALRAASADRPLREILVVDDGSTDNTAALAEAAGADAVIRQPNGGKGAALNLAFESSSGEILLLLDADLGDSAGQALALLEPLLADEADMAIATFPVVPGRGGGMGFVVRLARWGIRRLTGRTLAAPLSGQRAVRRQVLERLNGFAPGWGIEIDLTVRALWAGYRVTEVPLQMTHRVTGRAPADVLHRVRQFLDAARTLARLRRGRRRLKAALAGEPHG